MKKTHTYKLHETQCALCGSSSPEDFSVLFPATFSQKKTVDVLFNARRMPDRVHYQIVQCRHDGLLRSTPVFDEKTLATLYKKSSFTYHDEVENLTTTYLNSLNPNFPTLHLSWKSAVAQVSFSKNYES